MLVAGTVGSPDDGRARSDRGSLPNLSIEMLSAVMENSVTATFAIESDGDRRVSTSALADREEPRR
jgi:hypothetical protein